MPHVSMLVTMSPPRKHNYLYQEPGKTIKESFTQSISTLGEPQSGLQQRANTGQGRDNYRERPWTEGKQRIRGKKHKRGHVRTDQATGTQHSNC